jgi:hypothetical protein
MVLALHRPTFNSERRFLQAGFDGARCNLEGKLSSFIDAAYITSIVDEISRLTGETTASARAAESFLKAPPA